MPILEWPIMNPRPEAKHIYTILQRKGEEIVVITGPISINDIESLQRQLGAMDIAIRVYHVCEKTNRFSGSKLYSERVSKYLFLTRNEFYKYVGPTWCTTDGGLKSHE